MEDWKGTHLISAKNKKKSLSETKRMVNIIHHMKRVKEGAPLPGKSAHDSVLKTTFKKRKPHVQT